MLESSLLRSEPRTHDLAQETGAQQQQQQQQQLFFARIRPIETSLRAKMHLPSISAKKKLCDASLEFNVSLHALQMD